MQDFYFEYAMIDFATIAIILLAPILLIGLQRKIFENFNYSNVLRTINRSLLLQAAIGLIFFLLTLTSDGGTFGTERSLMLIVAQEVGILYPTIFVIFYLPLIFLLNLINKSGKNSS